MNNCPQPSAAAKCDYANIVGPQIRRFRCALGWSQSKLAIRLQLGGLDVGRDVVAQVECQFHCVKDKNLLYFAEALGVRVVDLFPPSYNLKFNGKP